MDRLRAAAPCDLDDAIAFEIALACRRGSDQICLVARRDMQRGGVGLRVDGYCAYAQAPRGTRNAYGDPSSVGYEDLVEHLRRMNHARTETTEKTGATRGNQPVEDGPRAIAGTLFLRILRVCLVHCFGLLHAGARFSRNALVPS